MKKWQTDRDTGIAGARFRRTVLSVGDISASEAQLVRPGWEVGLGNTTEQRCGLLFTSSQRCWVYFTVRLRKQFQLMSVGDISGRKQYSRLCVFFLGGWLSWAFSALATNISRWTRRGGFPPSLIEGAGGVELATFPWV